MAAPPDHFVMNVAFTIPVNDGGLEPQLTHDEFWRGLRRGGPRPQLFAPYVASTEILPGSTSELSFRRRLTMADGAVHTKGDSKIDQSCRNVAGLMCEAITDGSGAKSTMLLSRGGRETDGEHDIYLSAVYELHVPEVAAGSEEATKMRKDYEQLARSATKKVIETIRGWKQHGSLDAAEEEEDFESKLDR